MRKLFLSICITSSVLAWAGDVNVSSPNGQLQVTVSEAGGRVTYSAVLDGQQVTGPSALGLKTSLGDLTKGISLKGSRQESVSSHYKMRGTKASEADYQANRLIVDCQNAENFQFSIIFQVSDNDIAFRYEIPRQKYQGKEPKRIRIRSEVSSFNFPDGTTTFISPQIGPESGWEQTNPVTRKAIALMPQWTLRRSMGTDTSSLRCSICPVAGHSFLRQVSAPTTAEAISPTIRQE